MESIKILYAEDHTIIRQAVKMMLSKNTTFDVQIDEVKDGESALKMALNGRYDLFLIDINLPNIDGLSLIDALMKKLKNPKVLAFTAHDEPYIIQQILEKGALGYIHKGCNMQELTTAIEKIYDFNFDDFEKRFNCNKNNRLINNDLNLNEITNREMEILQFIIKGNTDKEIARILNVSARTVGNHRYNLITKIGVKNSIELAVYAIRSGIVKYV